jgi:hypothetical protein
VHLIQNAVEPGLSNVLARYAEKNLFSELNEVSTKDGSSLEVQPTHHLQNFSRKLSAVTLFFVTIDTKPPAAHRANHLDVIITQLVSWSLI